MGFLIGQVVKTMGKKLDVKQLSSALTQQLDN
jgi:Asp-tRNA(Asn)/Glu-tRNA(Gln) amidotransferase B subunit